MLVCCVGLIVGGCNESSEPTANEPSRQQEDVARVASTYLEAFGSGDFMTACQLTAPSDIADTFQGQAKVCARRLAGSFPLDGDVVRRLSRDTVGELQIEGCDAVANLASGGYLRLVERGGSWYVRFT